MTQDKRKSKKDKCGSISIFQEIRKKYSHVLQRVLAFRTIGLAFMVVGVAALASVLAPNSEAKEQQKYLLNAECLKKKLCLSDVTEQVLERFGRHAFGFESDTHEFDEIARWEVEVRAQLAGGNALEASEDVRSVLNELSYISGVPVTAGPGRPNFVIVVDERPLDFFLEITTEKQQRMVFGSYTEIDLLRASIQVNGEPDCGGYVVIGDPSSDSRPLDPGFDFSNSIAFTLILAEYTDDRKKLLRCLYEEMYQGFGLFNDSTNAVCTMFDNNLIPDSPTALDRLLLALLYYSEIKSGMNKKEVLNSLRNLLSSYEPLRQLMIGETSCQPK